MSPRLGPCSRTGCSSTPRRGWSCSPPPAGVVPVWRWGVPGPSRLATSRSATRRSASTSPACMRACSGVCRSGAALQVIMTILPATAAPAWERLRQSVAPPHGRRPAGRAAGRAAASGRHDTERSARRPHDPDPAPAGGAGRSHDPRAARGPAGAAHPQWGPSRCPSLDAPGHHPGAPRRPPDGYRRDVTCRGA